MATIQASIGLNATWMLFGTAGRIAPSLAGRLAFQLFARTAHPDKVSDRERLRLFQAGKAMAQAELHFLPTRQGISVAAHEFAPTAGQQEREHVGRWCCTAGSREVNTCLRRSRRCGQEGSASLRSIFPAMANRPAGG